MKKEIRIKVYQKYDGHCAYCGKDIEYKDMQVDHLFPKCSNASDIDNFDNLMPSCRRCNHYKRASLIENFREQLMTIQERLMKIYIFKVAVDYGVVKIMPFDGVFYFEKKDRSKPEGEEKKGNGYCSECMVSWGKQYDVCPTCRKILD